MYKYIYICVYIYIYSKCGGSRILLSQKIHAIQKDLDAYIDNETGKPEKCGTGIRVSISDVY